MTEDVDRDHPLMQFARGDRTRATYLQDRLTQMAERTQDPELRDLLRDVAAGRRTMRDLGNSDVFGRHAAAGFEHQAQRDAAKTAQERLNASNEARAEVQRVMGVRMDEIRRRFEEQSRARGRAAED